MSTVMPSRVSMLATGSALVAWVVWTILTITGTLDGVDRSTLGGGLEPPNSAAAQIVSAFALLTWPGITYLSLIGVAVWAARRRLKNLRNALLLGIVLGAGGHTVWKAVFRRERPDSPLDVITHQGWAYPSGHMVAVTVVASLLVAVMLVTRQSRFVQYTTRAGAATLVLLVAFDRWVMNAHWLSDIIGGILWGLTASALALVIARVSVLPQTSGGDGDAPAKRCAVVYNPTKTSDLSVFRRHVTYELETHGWAAPIWLETTADDPGHRMAREAIEKEVDLVLAAGGDGTVRAVCEELAGTDMAFGIVPAGTGNLLARNLGIPLDEQAALALALSATPRPIDLVELDIDDGRERHVFGVMAGIGIDAVIMDRTDSDLKKAVGSAAYFVAAAQNVDHPPVPITVTVDDGMPFEREALLVLIGNVGYLQGGIEIIPDAVADDGRLDLLIAAPANKAELLRMTRKVLTKDVDDDALDHVRARKVRIEAGRPEVYQMDGDTEDEASVLEARILPGALQIMLPQE